MSCLTPSPKSSGKEIFSFPQRILARFKETQRKIDSLKVKYRLIEFSRSRSTPRINKSSKIFKRKDCSPSNPYSKMAKTQEVLQNSRFIPKNLKLSLFSLKNASQKTIISESPKQNIKISSSRDESPQFYPSLAWPKSLNKSKSSNLPLEIENRNKLLFSLRKETQTRGFIAEPEEPPEFKDFTARTQRWLLKKKQKIEMAKAFFNDQVKKICTFKPEIIKRRYLSELRTLTTKSSEGSYFEIYSKKIKELKKREKVLKAIKVNKPSSSLPASPRRYMNESPNFVVSSYSNVSPIKMSLAYRHGFSYQLRNTFRPMVDYTKIGHKST